MPAGWETEVKESKSFIFLQWGGIKRLILVTLGRVCEETVNVSAHLPLSQARGVNAVRGRGCCRHWLLGAGLPVLSPQITSPVTEMSGLCPVPPAWTSLISLLQHTLFRITRTLPGFPEPDGVRRRNISAVVLSSWVWHGRKCAWNTLPSWTTSYKACPCGAIVARSFFFKALKHHEKSGSWYQVSSSSRGHCCDATEECPPKLKKKQAGWRFPSEYVHWAHE